jgi:hypothetical protein
MDELEQHEENRKKRLDMETRALSLMEKWLSGVEARIPKLEAAMDRDPGNAKAAYAYERLMLSIGTTMRQIVPPRPPGPKSGGPLVLVGEREAIEKMAQDASHLSEDARKELLAALSRTESDSEVPQETL